MDAGALVLKLVPQKEEANTLSDDQKDQYNTLAEEKESLYQQSREQEGKIIDLENEVQQKLNYIDYLEYTVQMLKTSYDAQARQLKRFEENCEYAVESLK